MCVCMYWISASGGRLNQVMQNNARQVTAMVELRDIRITIEMRDKGKHRTITRKKSKTGKERINKKEER